MNPDIIIDIMQQALQIISLLIAVILIPAMVIGLLISMFQAATSINEQTLSFVPKLFVTLFVLVFAGHWMLHILIDYTTRLFDNIPTLIG